MFIKKKKKKSGIMKSELDVMPLFLLDDLLKGKESATTTFGNGSEYKN